MIAKSVILIIYFWHYFLSFLAAIFLGQRSVCRFSPSCAIYTAEAIRKFGVVKGMRLGVQRILRCHPLAKLSDHYYNEYL